MRLCGEEIRIRGRLVRIASLDADKYRFLEDPAPVLDALRKSGVRVDLFTFTQKVSEPAAKYSYPMEWDNFAALQISSFDHWWTKELGFKARNKAKQAEKKGVVLREAPFSEDLVRGIWEIYNECPVRQGRSYPHFGKDLAAVHSEEATYLDHAQFIGAFLDDKLIGFVKLVTDESRTQAGLMNIVSMIRHRDKAPTNALLAQAVKWCAVSGVPYLVYSSFAYGKKEKDSLSDFKERNGFQRIDVPRYYIPLTALGAAAFRFGLHRKLVDLVPEPVAAKLRELRNSWYARKFHSVTEAS